MPITRVEPSRLYRRIADQIRDLILSGEFPPGSRLPPERDLAQQFGVSRPSLREALIALEVAGLVNVMTGSGIYVCTETSPAPDVPDAGPGPFELIRARRLIEPEIAAQAARSAEPLDIVAMEDAIEQMRAEERRNDLHEAGDRLFHVSLADATQNSALGLVVRGLWDQGRGQLWNKMQEYMHGPRLRPRWISEHAAVLDAVKAGDPDAARRAMDDHLAAVEVELDAVWNEVRPEADETPAKRRRKA